MFKIKVPTFPSRHIARKRGPPPSEGLGESPLSHLFLKLLSLLLNECGIVEVVYLHGFSHLVHGL